MALTNQSSCLGDDTRSIFCCVYEHQPSYLFHRDKDDIARHYLDDVDLQEPPDEELQLVKILQELQKEDGQAVDHQVPLILQV